jgi:hypothetical protein
MWDVKKRQVLVAGERGGRKFDELLFASRRLYRPAVTPVAVAPGDTSRGSAARARRDASPGVGAGRASRSCERCGEPLPPALLLQALPAGRLARAAEGPPFLLPDAQLGRDVRVVRAADARGRAGGGTVLL